MNILRALGDEAAAIFGDAAPRIFDTIPQPQVPGETERQRDQRIADELRALNRARADGEAA